MTDFKTDTPDSIGDTAQVHRIVRQVVMSYREMEADKPEIHPVVKWLVGAIAGFGSAALIGLGFWLVTSVSQMQVTLARMDERQVAQAPQQSTRDAEQDRRITQLEAFHRQGNGR